jgi:hypothetical protein
MKLRIWIILALAVLGSQAAERNRELAAGRDLYAAAEFRRAAVSFQIPCNTDHDAEACYWTGLSYERLADIRIPFGCRTSAKAQRYFQKATFLAPDVPMYRDALFDFLIDDMDCSRTALRDAEGILAGLSEADPEYQLMRLRLEEARHLNGSTDVRLGRLFLMIPQVTYRVAALPADGLKRERWRVPKGCQLIAAIGASSLDLEKKPHQAAGLPARASSQKPGAENPAIAVAEESDSAVAKEENAGNAGFPLDRAMECRVR